MSIYLFLYATVIYSLLFTGLILLKKYWLKNYWIFFIISCFSYAIWLTLYLFSFTLVYDNIIFIILSRFMYWLSLFASYNMLLFLVNFWNKKLNKKSFIYHIPILLIVLLCFFSPFFIKSMHYDYNLWINYEKYWQLYFVYVLLSIFYPIFYLIFFIKKYIKLTRLNKIRFWFIWIGFFITTFFQWLFLFVLPLFDIWLFQRENVVFFIPWVLLSIYSIHRYYFLNFNVIFKKIFSIWFSVFISTYIILVLKYYFWYVLDYRLAYLWMVSPNYWFIDIILWIIIYLFISKWISIILWDNQYVELVSKISKLQKKVSFISTFSELQKLLKNEFSSLLKTNYVNIILNETKYSNLSHLIKFFKENKYNKIFINDIVFIEENKKKFDYYFIKKEISHNVYLVFPLFNNKNEIIWIFEIWNKLFWNSYTAEEISIITDFVNFLAGHIKYLEIYAKINELNINLDKKIDEKTIEFNNLINKQNDFISMASHEIKSPLGFCIFQADCIIDDIKNDDITKDDLIKELDLLNNQLIKVWDLTKSIFAIQKYDIDNNKLYKKNVDFPNLILQKIKLFKKMYSNCEFIVDISPDIKYIFVDKIQFEQVIDNIIWNSLKFLKKDKKIIKIKAYFSQTDFVLEMDDNWNWIKQKYLDTIFDKYSTWEALSIWLWMWLYLCKKIIELHWWNIKANKSETLEWANFTIILPKNKIIDN